MAAKSFDTGIKFNYWNADNSGIKVDSHFPSLKKECLNSKLISIEQWQKIILKAKIHFDSKTTKRIKCKLIGQGFETAFSYDHGIEKNASISMKHLISIILYTDYSKLCTKMSATFRKITASETNDSVAKRNSKFFYFSKLLCEAVNDFGTHGFEESGPFYSGINCVLHISSFAITFYGPCSTSKQIEIAMNFSKSDGSIIQLHNDGFGVAQKFFDVSWISRFPDEDERVWVQGLDMMALRMVSIRIMRGSLNYKNWIHALHLFDSMVSGQTIYTKIKKEDIRALKALINGNHKGIHEYIINCFWLYCQKKIKIIIRTENNNALEDLVMAHVPIDGAKYNVESKEWQTVNNVDQKENKTFIAPKAILLELFPNLGRISIIPGQQRRFPLRSFLPFIEHGKSRVVYEIEITHSAMKFKIENLKVFVAMDKVHKEKYLLTYVDGENNRADRFYIVKK